jgi:AcrR family transcriptional regulator
MRGNKLSDHILWTAKNVFLEMGFERASMDLIASRAKTSKRTLYAHFENKEKLYFAVIDLVRGLVASKLKMPRDYSGDVTEALVMFCGRFLEILLYARTIQMCRLSIAEAARFPEGSALYFDVVFSIPHERLASYLSTSFGLSKEISSREAQALLGEIIHPLFSRALFGLETLSDRLNDDAIRAGFDLRSVRQTVAAWRVSMEDRHRSSRRLGKGRKT